MTKQLPSVSHFFPTSNLRLSSSRVISEYQKANDLIDGRITVSLERDCIFNGVEDYEDVEPAACSLGDNRAFLPASLGRITSQSSDHEHGSRDPTSSSVFQPQGACTLGCRGVPSPTPSERRRWPITPVFNDTGLDHGYLAASPGGYVAMHS
ncbi:hypothetical protein N658DRAFT_333439 [Parathielavia hyrcaniae]|uniref:Uncharacterized protein n=1 Tax=Parathielavia hyrcaniae TaxID=113614 RepID=A0AAN6PU88_9PEZI|nr:hypothetical protein N658DRAFT_333439 [Parathielavia hyrcaniae]